MPKIQFSDVTPPEKRSIRNVPIPKGGRRRIPVPIKPAKDEPDFDSKVSRLAEENKGSARDDYYYPEEVVKKEERRSGKSGRKFVIAVIAFALILGFVGLMMTVFASATVNIVLKSQAIDVDMRISAAPEGTGDAMRYEVVKLSQSQTATVPAMGEESVEVRASGKIVIYNNFSGEPQRLITRTRFESPDGLIYRIQESVVVPGKSVKNGQEVPGSIEVKVSADEPGEKYNIKKTDFTIPGFKNDSARYRNFYARSSTDMTGGFVGKRKTVAGSDKEAALKNLDLQIQASLEKELGSKIPDSLTLLSGSIVYESRELEPKDNGSSVEIGKEVTAFAVMLDKENLSKKITDEYVSSSTDWENIKPVVKDFSLLTVTNAPTDLESGGMLELEVKGKTQVLADIDVNLINQRLLGAPRGTAGNLMDEFAGIKSLSATIRPVWKRSFPGNPLRIHIQTLPES